MIKTDRCRWIGLVLPVLFIVTVLGCGVGEFRGSNTKSSSTNQLTGKLVVTGSSTVAPLLAEIGLRFEAEHSGVRIDVQSGGSSRGIRDVDSGAADIGMSSRDLKASELTGADTTTIAWDGVAFVVNRDNPVTELSLEQLKSIYLGRVSDWSQVGGRTGKIVVSSRAEGRSELDLVSDYLKIESGQITANVVDGETQQSLKTVITNKNAITYTSVGAAQDAASRGEPLKLLPLAGVQASAETVLKGQFPLARPLVLVTSKASLTNGPKSKLIKRFIKFANSDKVADLATNLGFVPSKE